MRKKNKKQIDPQAPSGAPKKKSSGKRTWKMMDRASNIGGGIAARKATTWMWRMATGQKPPTATRHPDLRAREAVAWAVLAGVSTELSRLLLRRRAATYWVRSTGNLPPGMKPLKKDADTGATVDDLEEAALAAGKRRKGKDTR